MSENLPFNQSIAEGGQPKQALLRDPRSVEFDPQAGLGGAICLGEMGETGVD